MHTMGGGHVGGVCYRTTAGAGDEMVDGGGTLMSTQVAGVGRFEYRIPGCAVAVADCAGYPSHDRPPDSKKPCSCFRARFTCG